MARAGLLDHRKFKRLVHQLGEPVPHCIGYLECLWTVAYQQRSAYIGDAIDIALSAQYTGDTSKFVEALYQGGEGFIEVEDGKYSIHDLYDHAPEYVRKSIKRRTTADNGGHCPGNGQKRRTVSSKRREEKRREEKNNTPLPPKGESIAFDQFWKAYPRRVNKPAALRAFAKVAESELAGILSAIEVQTRPGGCLVARNGPDGRSLVPHPATWLNGRRWEDEEDVVVVPGPRVLSGDELKNWKPS